METEKGPCAPAYLVRYRKYDGSGEAAEELFECGKTYRLAWMDSQLGWKRPGYEFVGWIPWKPSTKARLCKYANGQPVKDLAAAGETVVGLDRAGQAVCKARVLRVQNPPAFDRTPVVTLEVARSYLYDFRNVRREEEANG